MGCRFFVHPRKKSSPEAVLPGFPLNHVRARGQTDTSTHHKRDRVPPRKETKTVATALVTPDPPPEAEDRPGRKSRRTLRYRPGGGQQYLRALDDRCRRRIHVNARQASPPPMTLGAPWGRGCPMPPQKHGRSCRTSSTLLHHSPGGCSGDCELQLHFWNTTRRRRRHAPALRRARHPERGGGTFCLGFRRRRSAWGTHGLGGV
jgi:hypothetical protein